jgi:uncharacterized membrane protein YedE/YeeE
MNKPITDVETAKAKTGLSPFTYPAVLILGMIFGITLVKSEVVRWQRVHDMFLFKEAHMYLIIGTAVVVGLISMQIIKRFHLNSMQGKPIVYKSKPYQLGVVIGGICFGAGWAITGACPGPIYAQIGGGEWFGLVTFAGAFCGMFLYALLKPKLPH